MPPGSSREGAPKEGCGNFLASRNIQKICELRCDWNRQGRTNRVHRTMYILDVISSVSRSSKCNKIIGGWGFASDLTGEKLTAIPMLRLMRPTIWPLLLREMEGRRRRGFHDPCPGRQKPLRRHCSSEVGQVALKHWFAGGPQFEVTLLSNSNMLSNNNLELLQTQVSAYLRTTTNFIQEALDE